MAWCRNVAGWIGALLVTLAGAAFGAGPAEELFRLVPEDAGVVLAVEDLGGHAREFLASPLAEGLSALPAVKDWLASDRSRGLRRARQEIEKALGENLEAVRDGLFGDAVVLALHVPAGGRVDEARGLILVRARDRALLDRTIAALNAARTRHGELLRVVERKRGETAYSVREFRPGGRPNEYYAVFPDGLFAWSNSEALLQGAIDRRGDEGGGLLRDPAFRKVRDALPDRSAASLFINPGFVRQLLDAAPRTASPEEERAFSMISGYLSAVTFAGAAIEWRDGVVLHVEEALEPAKLAPWIRRWASRPVPPEPPARLVPPGALAVVAGHVDFVAVLDAVRALVPEAEAGNLENLLEIARGMLLGLDVRTGVFPHLGPRLLAYLEPPTLGDTSPYLPVVVGVDVGGDDGPRGVAAALENGLRTVLAFYALSAGQGGNPARVESHPNGGASVTSLGAASPFAFAAAGGRLILGTSSEAVGRALAQEPSPDSAVDRLRAEYFPGAETFAWIDLNAVTQLAEAYRGPLSRRLAGEGDRPAGQAARDLDQLLAVARLFRAGFASSTADADLSASHRKLGLLLKGRRP